MMTITESDKLLSLWLASL